MSDLELRSPSALGRQGAEDAALAAALLAGEPGATTRAWSQLSPMVARLLRRRLAGAPDDQDLRQEIFLRFFARISELRNPRALRPFLFGICLGVTKNEQRRLWVRRVVCSTDDDVLKQGATAAVADGDAREALRRLWCILGSVARADRELFVSRHVDKLDLTHIARRQGWSLGVTKRRVALMNRRLSLAMLGDPAVAPYARGFFNRCGRQSRAGG